MNDEIINGLLLGDAHLTKPTKNLPNSHIEFEQSDKHEKYVNVIQNYLQDLGWNTNTYRYLHRNTNTWGIRVYASYNIEWTKLRHKWYPDGKKIVPDDLILTPKTLAHWFMCDGSCNWFLGNHKKSYIDLHSESFTKDEDILLQKQLLRLGIKSRLYEHFTTKNHYRITIAQSYSVNKFLKIIENSIIPIFKYKMKFPNVMTRAESARINGLKNKGQKRTIEVRKRISIKHKSLVKLRVRDTKGRLI